MKATVEEMRVAHEKSQKARTEMLGVKGRLNIGDTYSEEMPRWVVLCPDGTVCEDAISPEAAMTAVGNRCGKWETAVRLGFRLARATRGYRIEAILDEKA